MWFQGNNLLSFFMKSYLCYRKLPSPFSLIEGICLCDQGFSQKVSKTRVRGAKAWFMAMGQVSRLFLRGKESLSRSPCPMSRGPEQSRAWQGLPAVRLRHHLLSDLFRDRGLSIAVH